MIKDLSLTESMRDSNGKSILHHICQALSKCDEDFTNFQSSFEEVTICADTTDVRAQLLKFKGECLEIQTLHKSIQKMDKANKLSHCKFG